MAIVNGYCTLAALKGELQIENTADDVRLERVIEATSRWIDEYCGQFFYNPAADQTRYYTARHGRNGTVVYVDPVRTVTTLSVATVDGGTYTDWTTSDYILEPRNAASRSPVRPYESVRAPRRSFPATPDGIRIVGRFGWAAIPQQVVEACLLQASRVQKLRDAPFGIASVPSLDGGGMRLPSRIDPNVEAQLKPFRRVSGLGMIV